MTAVLSPIGFLEFRNRPAGRNLSVSVFNTPDHAIKTRVCEHIERKDGSSTTCISTCEGTQSTALHAIEIPCGISDHEHDNVLYVHLPDLQFLLRFPSLTKENLTSDTLPDVQERAHHKDVRPAYLIRPIVGLNFCRGITAQSYTITKQT